MRSAPSVHDMPVVGNAVSGTTGKEIVKNLRKDIKAGREWSEALIDAIARWYVPQETYRGRYYNYFIGGEAFDWLLLAERLCEAIDGMVPVEEKEKLLFSGEFPSSLNIDLFKDKLGVEKCRGYLNFHYGVTVEEALQLATELEVLKRQRSNGVEYRSDYSEEAFSKIYGASKNKLLTMFKKETGLAIGRHITIGDSNEFTYWLFKYRLKASDKARIASDTRKGLDQLERMRKSATRK